MATQRIARSVWEGDLLSGRGAVTLNSGAAPEMAVTWKARAETPDSMTSPEELIAGAHAACFSMALSAGLARDGHRAERLAVQATVTFAKTDAGFRITAIHLQVNGTVPGIPEAAFQAAARDASEGCPVSQALKNNVPITVDAGLTA